MFGDIVRRHRRRLGLTQEDLAERTGISVRTIGKVEANRIGAPRPATVRLLADAFGLDGDDRNRFCTAVVEEPAGRRVADRAGGVVPRQLPAVTGHFVGRTRELAALDRLASSGSTTVVVSAIAGTAGIGKTALALHWAHRAADRFPDGQLYVDLRGHHPTAPPVIPAGAVRGFLEALGVDPIRIPATMDAQTGLYRSLLSGKRILTVLDNAHDADQVRPLLPATPTCLVLVTSRNRLTSLTAVEDAHPITLDLLSTAESRQLLTQRLNPLRVAAEPHAVDDIIARCAGLPLALAVVAARAAAHPTFPLATLAQELGQVATGLDALAADEATMDLRAVFACSYQQLSAEAARLFRLLGLHPGPDISARATASLTGLPVPQVRPLLAELTCAHLLTEHVPGRYTLHDLLRAYATEQTAAVDTEDQRRAATHRMLDHYLHTARTAAILIYPTRDPITPTAPRPGTSPEPLADLEQAMAWFTAEHAVLLAAVDRAATAVWDIHAWQLAWALMTFLSRRGRWDHVAATQRAAMAAARRLADPAIEALAHRYLAQAYTELDRLCTAQTHFRRARDLYRQVGDQIGQAHTHINLGMLCERQGRYAEALEHARLAKGLFQGAGHSVGQADALNSIGWYQVRLGNHRQALGACRQALTLHQEIGDRVGQAGTWDSLGYAHHHLGDHSQAVICYQHALRLLHDLGNRLQRRRYSPISATPITPPAIPAPRGSPGRTPWPSSPTSTTPRAHRSAGGWRSSTTTYAGHR